MKKNKKQKIIGYLRTIARAILVALALFWFIFALLSGAEEQGGGIIENIPNALPWLILFLLVYVVWKWEQIGGGLLILLGIVTMFLFDALESPVVLFVISLPLICLGGVFLYSWYLGNSKLKSKKS